jgi:multidrug efflux pump subunit AcrA (membrane-fusion protein)
LVVRPVQGIIKFLNIPGRRDEVKAVNLVVTAVVAAGIAAAIALIPLPQRVWCGAELRPRGEETVYVTEAGRLESLAVKAGAIVKEGDELARLSSIDLDLQITELEGKATDSRTRLASLQRERFTDPAAGLEIGTVEESLKSIEEQLEKKKKNRTELVLRAPRAGVVLPAPSLKEQPEASGRLPPWSGNALDPKNVGATFTEGTVLCLVGEPEKFEAVMVVDQSEVEFVAKGQHVDLRLDAFPWQTFTGTVEELAESSLEMSSERMSVKAGGLVPTETDPSGRELPISTSYEAMMSLDDTQAVLTPGMRGTARIQVGSRTVGQWLLRLVWQTFNFRM